MIIGYNFDIRNIPVRAKKFGNILIVLTPKRKVELFIFTSFFLQ